MMQGTQQLSKPVEGPELPADPHKVQPLQPETCPAITESTARREDRKEKKSILAQFVHHLPVYDIFH